MSNMTISFKTKGDQYTSSFFDIADRAICVIEMIQAGKGGDAARDFDADELQALRSKLIVMKDVQQYYKHNADLVTMPVNMAYLTMRLGQSYDWMTVSKFIYERAEEESKKAKQS